ncbi:hypothetical protein ACWGFX_32660 [Streptomyces xanthophaeus]
MPPTDRTSSAGPTHQTSSSTRGSRRSSTRTRTRDKTRSSHRRRTLRREVPSTVGLLADAGDFAAMCGYPSFTFDDHTDYPDYLHHVDGLLRTLAAQGIHTTVALFDPDQYTDYCAEHGLDPDTAATRARFTADLAGTGSGLPYTGRPVAEILPLLVDEAVRQATWEYATALLSQVGSCADCGEDIGQASFARAAEALKRLVAGAGPGRHHLVCSVPTEAEQLVAVLQAQSSADPADPPWFEGREGLDFVTVLAAGLALGGPGGLVLRSSAEGRQDRVHGWRLDRGRLTTLSAAAVFNAYCTDADTGEPVAPEPGVEYCPGYEVDDPGPHG